MWIDAGSGRRSRSVLRWSARSLGYGVEQMLGLLVASTRVSVGLVSGEKRKIIGEDKGRV